ncbi:MAG: choice-of-anchor J domain-containing protein [Taibaiella sp.]|nr:choice-of-anchor J domain-containing protein [Taibaiella sp.]
MKTSGLLGCTIGCLFQAGAQEISVTDFEEGTKSGYASASAIINGNSWIFNEALSGNAAGDVKNDNYAARLRYSTTLETALILETEMPDISGVSFWYCRSDFSGDRTGISPTIVAQVGDGTGWVSLDTLELAGIDELTEASFEGIGPGYGLFRIIAISGDDGKRFNIDDISIIYGEMAEPPVIDTLYTFTESFTECGGIGIGAFRSYSDIGDDSWHCVHEGRDGSPYAARMNGGFAAGESEANSDWLISAHKYDFSGMTAPMLSFWNKKQYEGTATIKVMVSTDYDGLGNPLSASWEEIHIASVPTEDWTEVSGIDLSEYKDLPFFLAFTYECGTSGAFAYYLDDLAVADEPSGISQVTDDPESLAVVGDPTSHQIRLQLTARASGNYDLMIYDLNGRMIYSNRYQVKEGENDITISNIHLLKGMYMIKVRHTAHAQTATVKAVVK